MEFLSPKTGYAILIGFGLIMSWLALRARSDKQDTPSFLLANREVGWGPGALSIAASWIWAPALFISVQVSYEMGLAGLFWFTAPNMAALTLFALLAPRIRQSLPGGYSLPQYIGERFKSARLQKLYLFPTLFYQLMAITVQLFAGGNFVALLTGIPLNVVMPLLLIIAVIYTWISGLKASLLTDVIQMGMILGIGALVLPITLKEAGGWSTLLTGIEGLQEIESPFDPGVAFSFGVVTSIGLIAGALSDQQYWQRSFSIKRKEVSKAFILGALLFGMVPIGLSSLGFLAAAKGLTATEGLDTAMIGVQTVATYAPSWATTLFLIMLLAGLSSTLDSGLSATSSLWATDIQPEKGIKGARRSMVLIGLMGLLLAFGIQKIPSLGLQHLWWIFNTIAACVAGPTLIALFSKRLNERATFWGIALSFFIGIPLFIYANSIGEPQWIVGSALVVVLLSTGISLLGKNNQSKSITPSNIKS